MVDGAPQKVLADYGDFVPRKIPLPPLEIPVAGQVHLWFLDLGGLAGSLRDALGGEQDRPEAITAGQLRFARRFYLRLLLGSYLGLPGKEVSINRQNRGKPELDVSVHGERLHFSMAKSEDRLLIGFATSDHIGVDLEPAGRRARNALGVARRYFTPGEADALEALPPDLQDAAFLRVWACKEAVVKASGLGIANQFHRFSVETDLSRPSAVLDDEDGDPLDWTLAMLRPDPGFIGAVAIQDRISDISAFRLLGASQEY